MASADPLGYSNEAVPKHRRVLSYLPPRLCSNTVAKSKPIKQVVSCRYRDTFYKANEYALAEWFKRFLLRYLSKDV